MKQKRLLILSFTFTLLQLTTSLSLSIDPSSSSSSSSSSTSSSKLKSSIASSPGSISTLSKQLQLSSLSHLPLADSPHEDEAAGESAHPYADHIEIIKCEYYNETQCLQLGRKRGDPACHTIQECAPPPSINANSIYGVQSTGANSKQGSGPFGSSAFSSYNQHHHDSSNGHHLDHKTSTPLCYVLWQNRTKKVQRRRLLTSEEKLARKLNKNKKTTVDTHNNAINDRDSIIIDTNSHGHQAATSGNLLNQQNWHSQASMDGSSSGSIKGGSDGDNGLFGDEDYIIEEEEIQDVSVKFKGCWYGTKNDCHHAKECHARRPEAKMGLYFCCCSGPQCNQKYDYVPDPNHLAANSADLPSANPHTRMPGEMNPVLKVVMYTFGPLFAIVFCVLFAYWCYRYKKLDHFNQLPTNDPYAANQLDGARFGGLGPRTPDDVFFAMNSMNFEMKQIQLLEVKAQGRFGSVYKALHGNLPNEYVAVKIFPMHERDSWFAELRTYQLPQMRHENVLRFLAADKFDRNGLEYRIITEYHERGSLHDYLKHNTLSYMDVIKIAMGIARGLNHLHEELPANKIEGFKPSIAHRDFKSTNVLLKSDLTPCVSDLGLALIFFPEVTVERVCTSQVGTRRYMAPEILEGAVNFTRDAFLRIDMYACGLVMWELLSRCSEGCIMEGEPVPEYRLPFEDELDPHPTIEIMQEVVVQQKKRPAIKDHWRKHPGLSVLVDTIEDLWDHDAEARLSASCVLERVTTLLRNPSITNSNATDLSPTTFNHINQSTSIPPPPPPLRSSSNPPRYRPLNVNHDQEYSFSTTSNLNIIEPPQGQTILY